MLGDVDAVDLGLGAGPEPDGLLDHPTEHVRQGERVDRDDTATQRLPAQLPETATGEQAVVREARAEYRGRGDRAGGEQTDPQRADPPADEMDADHVEGVVEAEPVLQAHRQGTHRAGHEAEEDGGEGCDVATGGGDGDQAGDRTRRGTDHGGPTPDPLDDDPAQQRGRGGALRVDERHRGDRIGGQLRTGVEPEPAEPQQAGAEGHHRHVVRPEAVLRPADPLTEYQCQRQRRGTRVDVHRGTAGEVQRVQLGGDEAAAPDPVRDRDVHQREPAAREQHPAAELGPVRDPAADQRHRDDREHHLESEDHVRGDADPVRCRVGHAPDL